MSSWEEGTCTEADDQVDGEENTDQGADGISNTVHTWVPSVR